MEQSDSLVTVNASSDNMRSLHPQQTLTPPATTSFVSEDHHDNSLARGGGYYA